MEAKITFDTSETAKAYYDALLDLLSIAKVRVADEPIESFRKETLASIPILQEVVKAVLYASEGLDKQLSLNTK